MKSTNEKSKQQLLFTHQEQEETYTTKPLPMRGKEHLILKLKLKLHETEKQILMPDNDFPTRLGMYVKIKLLRFTLNTFYK